MLLAYHLWEQVNQGETATLDSWARAYEAALTELDPEFDAAWRRLSVNHQKTMRAVIAGQGSPYRASALTRFDLEKTNAQWSVKQLIGTADLEQEGRQQRVVDPLFAAWIRRLNFAGMPRDMEEAAPGQAATPDT